MKVFASKEDRRKTLLAVLVVIAGFVGLYLAVRRYAPFVFDENGLQQWIDQFGALAPLVFVLLQTTQVIVAPIPGQILAGAGGAFFGTLNGTLYSLAGVFVGSAVAFMLAKRYGRSFVERVLDDAIIDRFDAFVDRVGPPGLLVFVVIPGLPDDAICFLGGLTDWRLRTFMTIIVIGRPPAYIATAYAGNEIAGGRFVSGIALVVIVILFSAVGYYKQEAIRDIVARLEPRLPF